MQEKIGDSIISETVVRNREAKQKRQKRKLTILLFYTLSVIIVCLTAFNFYLFCWIWSNLNGTDQLVDSAKNSNERSRLNLLSSWNTIKFNGRISSKRSFQVDKLSALNKRLKIMSPKSVLLLNNKNETVLELRSKEKRINFPSGLSVKSLSKKKNDNLSIREEENNELLVCSREDQPETSCQIKVPFVSLTNIGGVDFDKKVIQTSRLETKRLHSAINSLNLLSTNESIFESTADKVQLSALDEFNLLSRTSSVILDAKTIDVSRIKSFSNRFGKYKGSIVKMKQRGGLNSRDYKLCICLPELYSKGKDAETKMGRELKKSNQQSNSTINKSNYNNNKAAGLVFALKSDLDCSKFSSFVCGGLGKAQKRKESLE